MTVYELNRLLAALADEAQVLIADESAGKYVPATARIATKGLQAVIVIEAEHTTGAL